MANNEETFAKYYASQMAVHFSNHREQAAEIPSANITQSNSQTRSKIHYNGLGKNYF